jgi:predicted dehydrogenase
VTPTPAPVTAALLGAGNRGGDVYGAWALAHPDLLRLVAVADPDPVRRDRLGDGHAIPAHLRFSDARDLLDRPRLADAAIVALPDAQHEQGGVAALDAGYHVMLEKPVAATLTGTLRVAEAARKAGTVLMLGYVLRHTPFFQAARDVVRSGRLGQVVDVAWRENVHALHYAHSYVRGNWSVEAASSPMLLAKASHDLDLLGWITGLRVERVASFGNLLYFRPEHAPPGATRRCLDGCPAAPQCEFYAPRTYLTERADWPASVISADRSLSAREDALRAGPYGRCVYHAGNDVVDHQVLALTFAGGASGTLTVHGHSAREGRTLRVDGTRATLRGTFTAGRQELTVEDHDVAGFRHAGESDVVPTAFRPGMAGAGHGGGDDGLMHAFTEAVRAGRPLPLDLEVESHVLAFAAETARHEGRVVALDELRPPSIHRSAP